MMNVEVTPQNAKLFALHYLNHKSNRWDGYSLDDVADTVANVMIDFLEGHMTYDTDVAPHCDDYCL